MYHKLINVTALDGGGKGTQCELIKQYYDSQNIPYSYLHFPDYGNNEFSNIISAFLRGEYGDIDEVDPYFVATQFAMDMWKHRKFIYTKLDNGHLILDRYVFCNMAYQGAKFKDEEERRKIENWIYKFQFIFLNMPFPNVTLFLDTPIHIIKKRLEIDRTNDNDKQYLKGKEDIHEKNIDYQAEVRERYLSYKKYESTNYNIINCFQNNRELTPAEIFETYKHLL